MQNDPQVYSLASDTKSVVLCGLDLTAVSPPPPQGAQQQDSWLLE